MSDPVKPPATVTVVDPQGNAYDVPADQADAALAHLGEGAHVETASEGASRVSGEVIKDQASPARAAAGSFFSGLTLGGTDALQRALGGDTVATERDRAAYPVLSGVANIAGGLAPALLSGGASVAAEGGGAAGALSAAADAMRAGELAAPSTRGALSAVAGALPPSLVTRAGAATSEALGGGILGKVAGGAIEGGLFGAGQGLSDAALSEDPVTAENIMGHVSSDALLGAGLGGGLSLLSHGVGAAFDRAGAALREAADARSALSSVPEDLASLDENGLKAELKRSTAAHEADKEAEVASLESLRRDQRAELANQIVDLHEDMRTSKIYQAVNDDFTKLDGAAAGVEKIEGITTAQRQLAASNAAMSRLSKNPIALADNPGKALEALQMRQSALEALQDKMPKLRSALADNPAGVGLDSVDGALAQTKAQIEAIRAVDSRANPVTSSRLSLLKAGPSQRTEQVAAAQQALKDGKELGLVGKGVKRIASSVASGFAHLVPVPGSSFASHWMGERAGSAVEWLARKLSGTARKTAEATAGHASTFLDVVTKAPRLLKGPSVATATKTLSAVRFGTSNGPAPDADDLSALFRARANELKTQTMYAPQPDGSTAVVMRPDARADMSKSFDGLRGVAPVLADKLESIAARRVAYVSQMLPRKPDPGGASQIGPDKWSPSDLQIRRWARIVRATEDPESVEQRLAHGVITPEESAAYRAVFPERFAALQRKISTALPTLSKTLPMRKKVALSIFTGFPVATCMRPEIIQALQRTFAVEPGSAGGTQAPRPQPNFGRFGSLKDIDKPTPAQERQL